MSLSTRCQKRLAISPDHSKGLGMVLSWVDLLGWHFLSRDYRFEHRRNRVRAWTRPIPHLFSCQRLIEIQQQIRESRPGSVLRDVELLRARIPTGLHDIRRRLRVLAIA